MDFKRLEDELAEIAVGAVGGGLPLESVLEGVRPILAEAGEALVDLIRNKTLPEPASPGLWLKGALGIDEQGRFVRVETAHGDGVSGNHKPMSAKLSLNALVLYLMDIGALFRPGGDGGHRAYLEWMYRHCFYEFMLEMDGVDLRTRSNAARMPSLVLVQDDGQKVEFVMDVELRPLIKPSYDWVMPMLRKARALCRDLHRKVGGGGEPSASEGVELLQVDIPRSIGVVSLGVDAQASRDVRCADDYAWMTVGARHFQFYTLSQRMIIGALYRQWMASGGRDGSGMTTAALMMESEAATERLRVERVFKNHPALGTLLRRVSRGVWALYVNELLHQPVS